MNGESRVHLQFAFTIDHETLY